MRRKFIYCLIFSVLSIMVFCSCKNIESTYKSIYADKYDFYDDSVQKLKNSMNISDKQADKMFGILLQCGIDSEITYLFKYTDSYSGTYYKIWCGLNCLEIYLENDEVDKIIKDKDIIYSDGEFIKVNPNISDTYVETETEDSESDEGTNTESDNNTESSDTSLTSENEETAKQNETSEPVKEETTIPEETEEEETEKEQASKIKLVSLTSPVLINNKATITIKGKSNTEYDISVFYSSGESSATGLENKTSDSYGVVSWTWKVGARTKAGTYDIRIIGGGETFSTEFTIVN